MNPPVSIVIVTYRDALQKAAEKKGQSVESQERAAVIRLSPGDLKALGVEEYGRVKLRSDVGIVVVEARLDRSSKPGFGYMPVSRYTSELISYDPTKAKLPNFKRIEVQVEPSDEDITIWAT